MLDFEINPIIAKINNNEKNGFIAFFNHTFQYLYARAKYLFPNNVECKHFLLAIYENIYENLTSYSSVESIEHWLSLAVLETYNQILKENQIKAFEQISDPKTSSILTLESSLGSTEILKETSIPILSNYISQMPALPKIISLCFYHDGLQTAEIAEIFDCPEIYVSWEIGKAKDYLLLKYKTHEANANTLLYPFSLPLLYASFEFLNSSHSVTKEFAAIVWEEISKNHTFKKTKKKTSITLFAPLIFSVLILALILIRIMGDGFLSSKSTVKTNTKSNTLYSTQNNTKNNSTLIPEKPKTTTTFRNADGSVKVYDEKGSEISTEDVKRDTQDSSSKKNTSSAPNTTNDSTSNHTQTNQSSQNQKAASDSSKAATNSTHTIAAPNISMPRVNAPTVNPPSVPTPNVSAPSISTPAAPAP